MSFININAVKIAALCGILCMSVTDSQAEDSNPAKDFSIWFDRDAYAKNGKLLIKGKLGIFVNCGSQLSILAGLDWDVQYIVTDLRTQRQYNSMAGPSSVSYDQSTIDYYGKIPCDRIINQEFAMDLANLWYPETLDTNGPFKVEAKYFNRQSNVLIIPDVKK